MGGRAIEKGIAEYKCSDQGNGNVSRLEICKERDKHWSKEEKGTFKKKLISKPVYKYHVELKFSHLG